MPRTPTATASRSTSPSALREPQRMIYRIPLTLIGLFLGGWMLFDGIHVIVHGKYFGPDKPGPWSSIFIKVGINPFSLGPLFILLGVLWLVFLVGTLRGDAWGWYFAAIVAIASLWYLPVGTVLSMVYLITLLIGRATLLSSR